MISSVKFHVENIACSPSNKERCDFLTTFHLPRQFLATFLNLPSVIALCSVNRSWSVQNRHPETSLVLSVFLNLHRDLFKAKELNKLKIRFSAQEIRSLHIYSYSFNMHKCWDRNAVLEGDLHPPSFFEILALMPYLKKIEAYIHNTEVEYGLSLLNHIHTLKLANCSDSSLSTIKSLTSLHCLRVVHPNTITDSGLQNLRYLTSLQELTLSDCGMITDEGIKNLSSLPNLHSLDLQGCNGIGITDRVIQNLSSLPALHNLTLSRSSRITDEGLQSLSSLAALQILDLSSCHRITSVIFLNQCPALKSVNFSSCDKIPDVDLKNLSELLKYKIVRESFMLSLSERLRRQGNLMRNI